MLARLSGIATRASLASQTAFKHNFKGCIAGTRKTTPGMRLFEKYALVVGGCSPHRTSLSDLIMLKDNHIDAVGKSFAWIENNLG